MKTFHIPSITCLLLCCLALIACSSTQVVEDTPYSEPQVSSETPQNPAVVALRAEADRQLAAGNLQLAANALERGIRIAPRDPRLRQQLAEVRLRQGDYVQAKSLARMAVVYGRGQPEVQADAWDVIGRAETEMGNLREADLAFEEARSLRDQW